MYLVCAGSKAYIKNLQNDSNKDIVTTPTKRTVSIRHNVRQKNRAENCQKNLTPCVLIYERDYCRTATIKKRGTEQWNQKNFVYVPYDYQTLVLKCHKNGPLRTESMPDTVHARSTTCVDFSHREIM
jgi:hypothetical protein